MNYARSASFGALRIAGLGCALVIATELVTAGTAMGAHQAESAGQAASRLDFETYRTRIEPIFLKTRENGVRCYDCHSMLPTRLHLARLTAGSSTWAEEQSRQNFTVVSQLVTPDDPLKSRLLLHPL